MTKVPTFVVDENSEPEVAAEAMKDLRRMVRYGDMAKKALREIKQNGYYDGLTPLSSKAGQSWQNKYSKVPTRDRKQSHIQFVCLPRRIEISRSDLGDLSQLRVEVGSVEEGSFAGHTTRVVPVYISGPFTFQVQTEKPIFEIKEGKCQVGQIRINKGYLSWISPTGAVHRLYKDTKYPGAKDTIRAFAMALSKSLISTESADPEDTEGLRPSAKTLDLRSHAWNWILNEGHAERLISSVFNLVHVADVMGS